MPNFTYILQFCILAVMVASAQGQPTAATTQTAATLEVKCEELLSPEQLAATVNAIVQTTQPFVPETGELGDRPRKQIISAIVDAIQHRPEFRSGTLRTRAYGWLLFYRAADSEDGFNQLITGLRDSAGRIDCVQALALAPRDKHAQIVQQLGQRLPGARGVYKQEIVQTLGRMGPAAVGSWVPIEQLFLDRRARLSYRLAAASAMLQIKPLEATLKHVSGKLDSGGQRILLLALGRFGVETQFTFKTSNPDELEFIREFAIENISSPELENRQVALEALPIVFGSMLFINNQLEPRVAAALQKMADRETDPLLRQRASDKIEQLKKMPLEDKARLSQPMAG